MAKIVICEDDATIQKLIRTALRATAHELSVASDGIRGLELVERERPALVLTDVAMPGLSGLELADQLRARPHLAHIPVVLISAAAPWVVPATGACHGAAGSLTKPFSPAALRATVEQVLATNRRAAVRSGSVTGHRPSEHELRRAVEQDEIQSVYQPIVELATGAIRGVEALARWQHPAWGVVGPDAFIPLAEETGLIVPLGLQVLEQACHQVRTWQRTCPADPPLRLAVNLSVRQLQHPGLVAAVGAILERSGLDPQALTLEITERLRLDGGAATSAPLGRLKALGVRLALDDLGTSYASLAALRHCPVDILKLDRSLVRGLTQADGSQPLVRAILAAAAALRLAVIAEGIEEAAQVPLLRTLGCTQGQGYLFARPLPAPVLADLLVGGRLPSDGLACR